MTVWLRRQEVDLLRTKVLAQVAIDLAEKGAETTAAAFKELVAAAMPYSAKSQKEKDSRMKEAMEREVKKGVIVFNAPQQNPLVEVAHRMSLPDEFRQKLDAARAAKKRTVEL